MVMLPTAGTGSNFMVTIKEIASEAGVAISTVSYVLNHPEGTAKASAETRQRILAIARKHRYKPNAFGRGLRTGKSYTVGILGQMGLYDSNVGNTLYGASEVLRNAGYNLVLTQSGRMWQVGSRVHLPENPDTPEEYLKKLSAVAERLLTRGVDGILLAEVINEVNAPFFRKLASRIAVVKMFSDSGIPEIPSVYVDPVAIGRLGADHLLKLGHRTIAVLGNRPQSCDEVCRVWAEQGPGADRVIRVPESRTFEQGRETLQMLQEKHPEVTGILAYNDTNAAGILYEAHLRRVSVPETLSVCGVNNLVWSDFLAPRLTTVSLPAIRQGEIAGEVLIARMQGKTAGRIIIPPELICRDSTGPVC